MLFRSRAESGRSIEEAASHELLMTPEGAFDLGSISGEAAAVLGIPDSGIQANVGVLRHAEREHGSQIRNAGYENVQTFMLDVLSNWKNIYEGTGDSLWLVLPKKSKHGAVAAIRLALNQEGVYRVNTLMYVRERSLKNRKLLFAERPSSTVSPGTDTNLTQLRDRKSVV